MEIKSIHFSQMNIIKVLEINFASIQYFITRVNLKELLTMSKCFDFLKRITKKLFLIIMARFMNKSGFMFIFKIICLSSLIFQSIELLNDFSMGKTVISLEIKRLEEEPIPALTLCSQNWLSINKLSNYSHNNKEIIHLYREMYLKFYDEYEKLNQGNLKENEENVTQIVEKIKEIYVNMKNLVGMSGLTPFEIMSNYSIRLIDQGVYNSYMYFVTSKESHRSKRSFANDQDPIESFIPNPLDFYKCFTFYSHLKNDWRLFKIKLQQLEFNFLFYKDTFPGWRTGYGDLLISIHSPNSFPKKDSMVKINSLKSHQFYYSQVNLEMLGDGYETNCFEYELDYKTANFNMRSDCISSCIEESFENQIDYSGNMIKCRITPYPLRYVLFTSNKQLNICQASPSTSTMFNDIMNMRIPTFEHECSHRCRMDCNFKYYLLDHKEFTNTHMDKSRDDQVFQIFIKHGNLPDILIKYLPQTTFLTFICNFGGLLGMWLGLSVLSIFEDSSSIIFKIIQSRTINWQKIENILKMFSPRIYANTVKIIYQPKVFLHSRR